MKIEHLTRQNALAMMGSEASEAEADAMLELLRASGRADTDEIPDGEWRVIMDHAIARAGGTITVRVYDYADGTFLGMVHITRDAHEMYQESAQWPQGIIAAGDVLSGGDRDRLGITSGQTIWLEDTAP